MNKASFLVPTIKLLVLVHWHGRRPELIGPAHHQNPVRLSSFGNQRLRQPEVVRDATGLPSFLTAAGSASGAKLTQELFFP